MYSWQCRYLENVLQYAKQLLFLLQPHYELNEKSVIFFQTYLSPFGLDGKAAVAKKKSLLYQKM